MIRNVVRNHAYLPFIILGLFVVLGCSQLSKLRNAESTNTSEPTQAKSEPKEWKTYDLDQTDIKVDLPQAPKNKTPPMPPSYKEIFSAAHIYSYDDKDFGSSMTELVPTGKRKLTLKELADTSMTALKRQMPDLTYTLDTRSDTNTKYNGTFTRNGKSFDVRGCCIYKKDAPARVWAVLTLIPRDNAEAATTAQRIIDSVSFKNSSETCK